MKPAILIIGAILLVIAGIALFDMVQAYGNATDCVEEHGYYEDECGDAAQSAGSTMIICSPIVLIFSMVGMVLFGDGLK